MIVALEKQREIRLRRILEEIVARYLKHGRADYDPEACLTGQERCTGHLEPNVP